MLFMSKYIILSLLEYKLLEIYRFAKFERTKVWYIGIINIRKKWWLGGGGGGGGDLLNFLNFWIMFRVVVG